MQFFFNNLKFLLTWIWLSSFISSLDLGPGICVLTLGPLGSPDTSDEAALADHTEMQITKHALSKTPIISGMKNSSPVTLTQRCCQNRFFRPNFGDLPLPTRAKTVGIHFCALRLAMIQAEKSFWIESIVASTPLSDRAPGRGQMSCLLLLDWTVNSS